MSASRRARELGVRALRRTCARRTLGFRTTAELAPVDGTIGQPRAEEAIAFALGTEMPGYNLFVTGPPGTGKRTALEARLRDHARGRAGPRDWVYLHNFADDRSPLAVALSGGRAARLAADMRRLLDDTRRALTDAFESSDYQRRSHEAVEPLEREQADALAGLRVAAEEQGIAVELTPTGVVTIPRRGTRAMTPAEYAQLPPEVRRRYERGVEALGPRIEAFVTRMRALQRQGTDQLRALERDVALFAIGHLVAELKQRYGDTPGVVAWLDAVADDVPEHLDLFRPDLGAGGGVPAPLLAVMAGDPASALARYEVNAFVAHEPDDGAPVVIESNPTYPNLFGRIEHRGVLGGGFTTDHRMLRPGAVHRANGGYLMLPAVQVLAQPLVWLKLKEVLRTGRIRLENAADEYALIPTATLTPEPIELDLKLVLVGDARLYELAYTLDEDVRRLFRVRADFDWRLEWDEAGTRGYASFISGHARAAGLRHFDAGAVARIVEHGARLVESQRWLSTRFGEIAALASEASHCAAEDGNAVVGSRHVTRALERRDRRSNLTEQQLLQMVAEGTLMLELDGERTGQVNGLSVHELGDYAFGRPVRITATAGPGRGAVVSIERETELSGHIHDKGFLTLGGYLRERYGSEDRLALTATLTFEQSYAPIDGDSAASAELYALLSELSGLPVRQGVAVTGSVNQYGQVQAIGGVNEKIEGFHRTCRLAGLTRHQGVIIPEANVHHLMLSDAVIDSVRAGLFHIWSVADIDAGIALLCGTAAGRRGHDGRYPEQSVHGRVQRRLERWARVAGASEGDDEGKHRPSGSAKRQ